MIALLARAMSMRFVMSVERLVVQKMLPGFAMRAGRLGWKLARRFVAMVAPLAEQRPKTPMLPGFESSVEPTAWKEKLPALPVRAGPMARMRPALRVFLDRRVRAVASLAGSVEQSRP